MRIISRMAMDHDLLRLEDALNGIATLYQFRSLNTPLYGPLTVSQSYCLRILFFNPARTMSELAAELHIRLSTITGVIDQLEEKKLVERVDHPEDRRSLQVRLTSHGRNLYRGAHEAFLSHIEPLLGNQSVAEREKLILFLGHVTAAIRGWQQNPRQKAIKHGKTHPKN